MTPTRPEIADADRDGPDPSAARPAGDAAGLAPPAVPALGGRPPTRSRRLLPRRPGPRPLRGAGLRGAGPVHDDRASGRSGLPAVRGLSNFHETNVRTYVHAGGRDPGVWFFSLDAANADRRGDRPRLVPLPYYRADEPGRRGVADGGGLLRARRGSDPGPTPAACCGPMRGPAGRSRPAVPGTLEHFLAERVPPLRGREPRSALERPGPPLPLPAPGRRGLGLDETLLAASRDRAARRGAAGPLRGA